MKMKKLLGVLMATALTTAAVCVPALGTSDNVASAPSAGGDDVASSLWTYDGNMELANDNTASFSGNYSESPLVEYTVWSPNNSGTRYYEIDTITIHCMAAPWTAQRAADYFGQSSAQASANYNVGYDGSISQSVSESERSWCTSNWQNDNRAITIEVGCETYHPYAVPDVAIDALVDLVADICARNNIKQLLWQNDVTLIGQITKQNMTVHRWFANKACPGDYLMEKHTEIAERVNTILGTGSLVEVDPYYATVSADSLNVRSGASTNYDIVSTLAKGDVVTIVAEQSGWGQLKDDAGWISLDYVTKGNPTSQTYSLTTTVNGSGGVAHFGGGTTSTVTHAYNTVYFQTTPDSGYRVSSVLVDGSPVDIQNDGADSVYSFTMPQKDVSVVVAFAQIPYSVRLNVNGTGGVAHFGTVGLMELDCFAGQTPLFQTTPDEGYVVSEVIIDGESQEIQNDGGDCVYGFTMPEKDVTVTVTFAPIGEEPSVALDCKMGDKVMIKEGAKWADGKDINAPSIYKNIYTVQKIKNGKAYIGLIGERGLEVVGSVNLSDLTEASEETAVAPTPFQRYQVTIVVTRVTVYAGASDNCVRTGVLFEGDTVTIVAVAGVSANSKGWGKLSSGNSWISLEDCEIYVND